MMLFTVSCFVNNKRLYGENGVLRRREKLLKVKSTRYIGAL